MEYEVGSEHGTISALVADWNVDAIHQENGHMEVSFTAERTWTLP